MCIRDSATEAKGPFRAAFVVRRQRKVFPHTFIFIDMFALIVNGLEGNFAGTGSAEGNICRIVTNGPLLVYRESNSQARIF